MIRVPVVLAVGMLLGGSAAASANLLTCETDFETGADGWCGSNPSASFGRAHDGATGAWSMELRGDTVRSAFIWDVLRPQTDYTFSGAIKGSGGTIKFVFITDAWQYPGACEYDLRSNGWRKVSFTFRTPGKMKGRAFYLQLQTENAAWARVDSLRLDEGRTAAAWEPEPTRFFAGLEEPGDIHLEEDGAPVMRVRARTGASARVLDAAGGTVASAALGKDGSAAIRLPSAARSGYYPFRTELLDAKGNVLAAHETPFAVTRRARPNGFFGISFSSSSEEAALRRVGFTWTRSNTLWWMWEQKEDKPFPATEPLAPREGRFRRLGTTGGVAPEWARGKGRRAWTDDPKKALPFIEHLLKRTALTVDQYEIINEPDLVLPRQEKDVTFEDCIAHYCDILKTVAPAIHGAGKPVVIDVSGCDEGNELISETLKRVPDAVDIVSIHPYSWPREFGRANLSDPETGGFLDDLHRKMTILRRHPDHRVVIGELGWALGMDVGFASADMAKYGWYLARMFALARSFRRIEYLIWFSNGNTPEAGLFDYCLWRMNPADGSRPTAAVAAACEASRQLPEFGSGDVRQVLLDGVFLLRWRKDGEERFVYWTDEDLRLPVGGLGRGVRARGTFGEPLDPASLTVSGAPVYLSVAPSEADALEKRLVESLNAAYAKRKPFKRDEHEIRALAVRDLATFDFLSDPGCVSLSERKDVMPPDPTVQWNGPDDLSVRLLAGYDEENFYFFAAVTDDEHRTPFAGKDQWRNDCIQIAFDPKDNAKRNSRYMVDDIEFGMCEGMRMWCWASPAGDGEVKALKPLVVRTGTTTEYRLAIPWRFLGLGKRPAAMGFAASVVDNDGEGTGRYYIPFGRGISAGKRPGQFKRLLLK